MAIRLIAEKGTLAGLVLSLEDGERWQIGKDPGQNDIVLEDKAVADSQALFFKNEKGFFIKNLNDNVPVKVNNQEIKKETLLKDRDTILLGGTVFSLIDDDFEDVNDLFIFDQEDEYGDEKFDGDKKEDNKEKTPEKDKDKRDVGKNVKEETSKKENVKKKTDLTQKSETNYPENNLDLRKQQNNTQNKANVSKKDSGKDAKENKQTQSPKNTIDEQGMNQENHQNTDVEKADTTDRNNNLKSPNDNELKDLEKEKKPQNNAQSPEKDMSQPSVSSLKDKEITKPEAISNNKKEDKPAFSVEDLFDFDDGIFPEIESKLATEESEFFVDLSHISRFLLKVISGPNIGAEYSLDTDKEYLLGSDSSKCDIVFNDLSVSHQHAKLKIDHGGVCSIEDLSSRNGIVIEGNHIEKTSNVTPDEFVGLGTTVFVVIDHQAPAATIVASPFIDVYDVSKEREKDKEQKAQEDLEEQKEDENRKLEEKEQINALVNEKVQEELKKDKEKTFVSMGSLIIVLCMGGLAVLFGIGTASLFHSQEIASVEEIDYESDLENIINSFSGVKFTFNKNSGQLFLLGHVKNSIDKSELIYKLQALPFVRSIDDNIVDNEAVWQEMNIILSKQLGLKGISMHSPEPGSFVVAGYVRTDAQLIELIEFLNLHFNYISLLSNKVFVETDVVSHIRELLFKEGLTGLNINFSVGELILTGYINYKDQKNYNILLDNLSKTEGVRNVKNFAVVLPLEEGVIDLSRKYPNRYQVTGYSKHGDVNINIVINGRILMRGDVIDGMTITSIQAHAVFLEKDGIKYKIDYNK